MVDVRLVVRRLNCQSHQLDALIHVLNRVRVACRMMVKVYSFNSKSEVWWSQSAREFNALDATYYRFPWVQIQALNALVARTMTLAVTISEDTAFITADAGDFELSWTQLQA